jgi:hypothetical protein
MSLQIPIFKCQYVKHAQGVEMDDYGFTIIDLRVIIATIAQVFYILDPKDKKKHIIVPGNNELSESTMWMIRKNTTSVMM